MLIKFKRKVKQTKKKSVDLAIRRSSILLLGTVSGVKKQKLDYNSVRNKLIESGDNILRILI